MQQRLVALLGCLCQPATPPQLALHTLQLQHLYSTAGFYDALHQIALDRAHPRDLRLLASLVLKNEMVSRWRAKSTVPDAEKDLIRTRFLAFLSEPDLTIATTNLHVLSKLSRIDYPRAWPELMHSLLACLLSTVRAYLSSSPPCAPASAPPELINTLWAINQLVKEWTTVKLPLGTKVVGEWRTELLMPVLVPLLEALGNRPDGGDDEVVLRARVLVTKVVSRLSVWEWGRSSTTTTTSARSGEAETTADEVQARTKLVFELVVGLLGRDVQARIALLGELRTAAAGGQGGAVEGEETQRRRLAELTRAVKGGLKHLRRMQAANPTAFAAGDGQQLGQATPVVLHLWQLTRSHLTGDFHGEDQETAAWPNAFKLTTLLLVKDLLPAWEAKRKDVMTQTFIAELFDTLVSQALVLSDADLGALEDEPEEWCVREGASGEQWTFELRPCAERVLLALNIACRNREDGIMQVLMSTKLSEAMATPLTSPAALRAKEAVYTAAGRLVRFVVADDRGVPAGALLSALRDECVHHDGSEWRPLKRRIAWLIGELVEADDELAASDLPWQPLVHLVADRSSASSDLGVRLTAAGALKSAMDLWELDPRVFAPYVPQITTALLSLLDELETLEGKRRVLGAVEVMSEREGLDIKPYVGGIAAKVPELWAKAASMEGEWLFKSSLLTMVTKLVAALGPQAHEITPLCIQLLGESLTGNAKLHLDEDALVLWQALLRNAHALDPRLAALVPAAVDQLATDRDQLHRSLDVLDSYVLLDGARVFEAYGANVCQVVGDVVATAAPGLVIDVLGSIALHVQVVPFETWAPVAVSTGLVKRLMEGASAPKVGTALPHFASLLARIVLAGPASFLALLAQAGVRPDDFFDLWWTAFDRLALSSMRKRVALASAALCTTGEQAVLHRFGELLNVFLDVLGELKESETDSAGGDPSTPTSLDLHWKRGVDAPVTGDAEGTAEGERLVALHERDPVYSVSLKGFLRTQLASTPHLSSYVDPADPAFVQLQGYLGS